MEKHYKTGKKIMKDKCWHAGLKQAKKWMYLFKN